MDEDGYIPQISQIDYNLMDNNGGGGTNGSSTNSSYYNPMTSHMPSSMYGGSADIQQQHQYQHPQMMQGQGMPPHAYSGMPGMAPPHGMMPSQMGQSAGMIPSATAAQSQPPAKPKRGGRKKNTANQPAESSTPTQQPLPASYPSHQMNPQQMMQMRQQQPGNPYNYQMQSSQAQQKWPGADYNSMQQQQYRPMAQQQPYPAGYPMHPSAQNYYAANQQQRPPSQYYQQQQYPPHYSGQTPQQPRYPTPQANQQQYYMDPNMYNNYAGHTPATAAYPQAGQTSAHSQQQKPDMMAQQSFQQQSKAVPPSTSMTPTNSSQPTPYPGTQQQPVSSQQQWPSYNGVPPNYYQQQSSQQAASLQNLQREIMDLEHQYQQYGYQQQKTPEFCMRMDQLYKKICYLKQQYQQMSMQQATPVAQQSPQTAANKAAYPNYPSNGQVMDSSTSGNSSVPPMSSASTVHHQQSLEKVPSRASISSQDPNSSVAVTHTAANQVQVNITPEAPGGRTLISVYHQYPSADVVTNSTNSTTPSTTNYKDVIPPEPVPSSLSTEHKSYTRNPQQIAPSSAPSTSTISPTVTAESKPKSISSSTSSVDYPNFPSTQQTSIPANNTSPIPPQPIPTTSSFDTTTSRQTSIDHSNEISSKKQELISNTKTEAFPDEHTIERVENVIAEDVNEKQLKTQQSTTSKSNGEEVQEKPTNEQSQNETEAFENELDDLQPPAAPRMISNYEEDEEDYEMEIRPNKNDEEPRSEKPVIEEQIPEVESKEQEEHERDDARQEITSNGSKKSSIHESSIKEVESTVSKKPSVEQEEEQQQKMEVEPSTSAKVDLPEAVKISNEFETTNDSSLQGGETSIEETMEFTEEPVKTPKSQPKKKAAKSRPNRSRKSAASSSSRKRKKSESEEEEDVEDYVPEAPSKKRAKAKSNAAPKAVVVEEPKFEDFVEKRRSERNKTERKTYSEKIDLDEDLLEEIPAVEMQSVEDSPAFPAAPEWIVEKILGVRVVTKMLPKEPIEEEEQEKPEAKTEESTTQPTDDQEKPIDSEKPESSDQNDKDTSEETNGKSEKNEKAKEDNKVEEKEVELEEVQIEEIYVKWKGKSYLHCEWKTVEELEEIDRRIGGKINRFKAKFGEAYLDDSEYFNEDYTVVDRVLDEHIDDETGEHSVFLKWRSLPYEDCTWEDIEIVPKLKLKEFHRRNDTIDPYKMKEQSRPDPDEWVKIPQDKEYKFDNTLREYQFEGVNWLLFCYYNKKTIQSITFLQGIYDKGIHGPFLIVVPLSTLHNWEREFENWTDMNAIVYHGGVASREIIQNYEMYYDRGDSKKKQIVKFDVLLTTYEMVVSDCEVLRKINYRVCVIDEAHRLKNRNSKLLTGGLLSFRMEHRVLLTGTPLQNNIQELFSLLNFLEPEQFSNSESFLEQFGQCQTEEQVQKLQEILKPMMLRRLKEDVEKSLQPKEETIIEVQLTNTQKKYYRAILERNFTHLLKGSSVPSLMNTVMELRKCCNHPFLIKGAEDQIISEFKLLNADKSEEELQLLSLIQASGKMVLIDKLLPKLRQDGHKVLVFSQMVKVLDLLEEFLAQMSYPYERIDGNIRGDHRQAAIDRFSKPDSDRFVFLLCTRAGGLGINLTAADTVIIYDSDWNPQNDLQAQARCHRIGQTKMVKVYRLITANTYEREMFDKASLKLGLDKAVLQSMTPKENQQQLTRTEIEDLLRKGAYGAVMDENDEGNKFNEEDIDTILQRRTQTIKLEPGVKGSTFAKASFASANIREDIDILDPNFWTKWAKHSKIDITAGSEDLIMSEPRARRKRFEDNYKGLHEGENESDGSDDDGEPGASKSRKSDFSKSRSGKKRRREDDDDYIQNYNAPDELTFNKSEFFKVEKLLSAWGWGRWSMIKKNSDITLSEKDIEHIARTLLLHCIREYRGEEKSREFVWQLIVPKGGILGKGGKKGVLGGGLYHEGWATLPEYNPPAFAVDSSFQRHVHRHANKLMQRMFHLFVLQAQILGSVDENTVQNKPYTEIQLDVPVIGDPPLTNWDVDCDKCFLIGIYKHGMENFDAIKKDPKLCFIEKEIEEMPTTIELNTRFKRIILMLSRKLEMALAAATNASNTSRLKRWPRAEEIEFMRLLRIYGVKDDHEGLNVINWNRFRELSTNLQQKTDAELLEELYCVLAMCTKQQGGDLSDIDRRRASLVESIPAKQAERLMFRLHLMRKIHAIITTGIQNVRTSLKLCSNKTMPSGWGELHDEQLMIVVDMHGLDNVAIKVVKLPAFETLKDSVDEQALLRRIMEICTTLETGRWNGKGSIEMLDDDGSLDSGAQTPVRSLTQQQSKRGSRKKNSTSNNPLASSASPANASQASATAAAQALMEAAMSNPNYLLPLLSSATGSGSSSSNLQQQQLQQFQALMTMYALSSMLPSMSDSSSSTANKQAMAALAMMGEDALNLTVNPKKATATPVASSSTSKSAAIASASTTSNAKSSASASNVTDPTSQFNIAELLALFNIPEETNIPVIHSETNAKLTGDKAPKLKNLDQWLTAHPKYRVDTSVMGGSTATPSTSTAKEATPTKAEKTDTNTSNGVFKSSALEPGEIPKTTASSNAATSSSTDADKSTAATEAESIKIGVFYKSTGVALPQDKWPSITNLEPWLTKNPTTQVQSVFAPFAKELLPKTMHARIGGEPSASQSSSSASNSLQQAATSAAAAASLSNAAMNLEALQVQMYLQQKLMESLNPTSYQNTYSSLLGTGSSSANATNNLASSLSSASGLDANSAALLALFGAQLPAASSISGSNQSAATNSAVKSSSTASALNQSSALSSNAPSSLMNEAALTAEILANPSLALLLNNGAALTNNNASSLSGSSNMTSFPFNMDFNTALQLNALTNAANLSALSQCSPNVSAASLAGLLSGVQTASTNTTPASSKKPAQTSSTTNSSNRARKLNDVLEKLSSSSNLNNNS